MALFKIAYELLMKDEGGFSNNPIDRGGPTNRGITQASWDNFRKRCKSPMPADVFDLQPDQIYNFYLNEYWLAMQCGKINSQSLANAVLSMGVLCGAGTIVKILQIIVGVKEDGIIGLKTIEAVNKMPEWLLGTFCDKVQERFESIAANNPSQKIFLKGWNNRINRFREVVA